MTSPLKDLCGPGGSSGSHSFSGWRSELFRRSSFLGKTCFRFLYMATYLGYLSGSVESHIGPHQLSQAGAKANHEHVPNLSPTFPCRPSSVFHATASWSLLKKEPQTLNQLLGI
jgi:hypothetical protein